MQQEAAERVKTCGGAARRDSDTRFDPRVAAPLIAIHAARLAIGWTGVSPVALAVAAGLFVVRAFGLTAGHHRDSNRAGEPSRVLLTGIPVRRHRRLRS